MYSDASDDEHSTYKRLKHRDRRYDDNKRYKLEIYKSRRRSPKKDSSDRHSHHYSKDKHYHKHHRRDVKDKRSSSESSMSTDSYRKHKKKNSRHKRSRSPREDAKHHKHSKKQHKEKKHKHSKDDKRERIDSKSSRSLINEIALNVLKYDKDSNNNSEVSYTPPLPPTEIFTFNPPLPPPEEKKEKVQEPPIKEEKNHKQLTEEEEKKKKKSVLDLPMPPIVISKPTTNAPLPKLKRKLEVLPPIKHDPNWELKFSKTFQPLNNNSNEHKEEMKNHLQKNSVILTPGSALTPEPVRRSRPRPSIIGKQQQELKSNVFQDTSEADFAILEQIGEGTYGKVYKAINIVSGKIVAMKLTRMENEHQGFPITSLREIKNLQVLKHPNIVELDDVVFTVGKNKAYLVFEFMNHDLLGLMNNSEMKFSEETIYHIISQVLEGLKFCHENQIIHRDMKPSNILLNNQGLVKLADFGLSRNWIPDRPYTNKVISLWYRPIELLLGEEQYKPAVDVWSLGCIMTELFKRSPLFPYSDEVDIVRAIYVMCGTPNTQNWPNANKLPRYKTLTFRTSRARVLRDNFSSFMGPTAVDLVDRMLKLNPEERISPKDALRSPWIQNIKKKDLPPLTLPSNDSFEFRMKTCRQKK